MSTPADNAPELSALQAWLQRAITAGPALALTEADAASVVQRSSRMSALERLGVYNDAYFARLLECLADDYPALRALLGRDRFAAICNLYIAAHPPRSPSLNGYGAGLCDFCASAPVGELLNASPGCHPALLRDIARIEWASVELIHAPIAVPLSGADILSHQSRFGRARLLPAPSVRLLRLDHPIHDLYTALRSGNGTAPPAPSAAASFELLHRHDWQVHCEALAAAEGSLLAALFDGTRVATALRRAATRGASEHEIGAYFQRWIGAGFFAAVA